MTDDDEPEGTEPEVPESAVPERAVPERAVPEPEGHELLSPERRRLLVALGFGATSAFALSKVSKSGSPTVSNVKPREAASSSHAPTVAGAPTTTPPPP